MTNTANPRAGPMAAPHLDCNLKNISIGQIGNAAGGSTTTL